MNASSARSFPRPAANASCVTASSLLDAVMANHLSCADWRQSTTACRRGCERGQVDRPEVAASAIRRWLRWAAQRRRYRHPRSVARVPPPARVATSVANARPSSTGTWLADAGRGHLALEGVGGHVTHQRHGVDPGDRRDPDRGDGPDAGGDHRDPQRQQPRGGLVHQMFAGHRPVHVGRHHAEIDSADLCNRQGNLEGADDDQRPPPVVRPQLAHPPVLGRAGLLAGACQNPVDQVRSLAGPERRQPASLDRRTDQPRAATAARFQVGIDLLREHLGTLTVQPRGQRLTRYVTPHPCIVAHARPARKDACGQ